MHQLYFRTYLGTFFLCLAVGCGSDKGQGTSTGSSPEGGATSSAGTKNSGGSTGIAGDSGTRNTAGSSTRPTSSGGTTAATTDASSGGTTSQSASITSRSVGGAQDAGAGGNRDAAAGGSATGGTASGGGGGKASGGSTAASGGTSGGSTSTAAGGAVFSQCGFHFGALDGTAKNNAGIRDQIDFITTGWMGQSDKFDMKSVCDETKSGAALQNQIPVIVAYVVAFTARRDKGLQDCNVSGATNLCKYGATYIRGARDRLISQYKMYAQGFADCYGTTRPIVFNMEPDFYQYSAGGDAQALTAKEAGQLMSEFVNAIKTSLPNARFSLDISPWIPNNGKDWYPNFDMSLFTFINTSGGGTAANNTKIRSTDSMTWKGVHDVTGKPIMADTGYGVAGTSTGEDGVWNVAGNINARIADGVISIIQYSPTSSWGSTISGIRSQLNPLDHCP